MGLLEKLSELIIYVRLVEHCLAQSKHICKCLPRHTEEEPASSVEPSLASPLPGCLCDLLPKPCTLELYYI